MNCFDTLFVLAWANFILYWFRSVLCFLRSGSSNLYTQNSLTSFSIFPVYRKAVQGDGPDGAARPIRQTPDWSDAALNGDHLWVPTSASGDMCYVSDSDCTVS